MCYCVNNNDICGNNIDDIRQCNNFIRLVNEISLFRKLYERTEEEFNLIRYINIDMNNVYDNVKLILRLIYVDLDLRSKSLALIILGYYIIKNVDVIYIMRDEFEVVCARILYLLYILREDEIFNEVCLDNGIDIEIIRIRYNILLNNIR